MEEIKSGYDFWGDWLVTTDFNLSLSEEQAYAVIMAHFHGYESVTNHDKERIKEAFSLICDKAKMFYLS